MSAETRVLRKGRQGARRWQTREVGPGIKQQQQQQQRYQRRQHQWQRQRSSTAAATTPPLVCCLALTRDVLPEVVSRPTLCAQLLPSESQACSDDDTAGIGQHAVLRF